MQINEPTVDIFSFTYQFSAKSLHHNMVIHFDISIYLKIKTCLNAAPKEAIDDSLSFRIPVY